MKEKKRKKIEQDETPLWKFLGLKKGFKCTEIDKVYIKLDQSRKKHKKIRLAWKILRDPYFGSAYRYLRSTKKIFEAGFFDDGENLSRPPKNNNNKTLVTPVDKIIKRLKNDTFHIKKEKYAVLLTTGAFSPIHQGHIEMMNGAKIEVKKQGFTVLGGYLSLSHDQYVSEKDNGKASLAAKYRLHLCQLALKNSDWLMADGWEALGNNVAIIYTEVMARLKKYLVSYIKNYPIEIIYVFGSDNAAFSRAFIKLGRCVCVERYGHNLPYKKLAKEKYIKNNKRIYFVKYKKALRKISSKAIRGGNIFDLEPKIRKAYLKLKSSNIMKKLLECNRGKR